MQAQLKKDGWTVIQEANAKKHILEISCFADKGIVTEIRKRHNDGEEEKITKSPNPSYHLPIPTEELEELIAKGNIVW